MIKHSFGLLFAFGLVAAAACGDDGGTGGSGGSATTGTGGHGGQGGGGPPPPAEDGKPCTANAECLGGLCIAEAQTGWPSGYCSGACDPPSGDCAGGGVCADAGAGTTCLDDCAQASDCRDGYACVDSPSGQKVCAPACTVDAQCPTLGKCDVTLGLCIQAELCSDAIDNDGDALIDCEDSDCTAACAQQFTAACGTLAAAQPSNPGNTTSGTKVFLGSCTGSGGAPEDIYSYTPPANGTLSLVLSSQVDLSLYVRSTCADAATELACVEQNAGGTDETLDVPVNGGFTVYIFVDGHVPGEGGAYTLDITFTP